MELLNLKFYMVFITALVPLVVGMIWYNKNVFGNAWMKATGITEESAKEVNMAKMFFLTYLFGVLASIALMPMVIHQMGFLSMLQNDMMDPATKQATTTMATEVYSQYASAFRSFKHGVFHGVLTGLFFALPVIGLNAIYEMKKIKYILINTGYWVVCLALMGGIICAWA